MKPRLKKWLSRIALVLVGLELLWVIGANLALNSDSLRARINRKPGKFYIEWSSGSSYVPGFFRLTDLIVRGQNRSAQYYVTLDEGRMWVSLWQLALRRVDCHWFHGRGLEFLLRRKAKPDKPEPKGQEFFPTIPGIAGLEYTRAKRHRAPWTVKVHNVTIDEFRELWINRARVMGDGVLTADLWLKVRGPIEIGSFSLLMPQADVHYDASPVATNLDIDLDGSMDSFRYKESKGRKLLQHLSTNLKMKGTLFEVGFFDEAVGHVSGIEFGGRAETDVDLHIERGLVLPESSFSLDSPEFEVRFLDYAVTGDATVQFDVEEADDHPRSTLEANVEDLQMFMKGHEDAAMVGTTLSLRSVSDEPNLARRFPIAELVFDLPYIEVPDVSVFNDTLPEYSPTRMVSGGAVVSTHFEIHDNRKAQGNVSFLGDEILVEALEEQYQASVELNAELRTEELGGKAFRVDGTTIELDRILIPGMKKAKGNDWWMHVQIPEGAIDLNEGTKIDATVDFQMRDVRPFIVLLKETRDEEKGPGWFWLIPDVKDIDGTVTMNMAPHVLDLEKLDVTGKGTKILAEMRVGGEGTDGLLFAKYKVFSAGIDFREGHKKWRMKKPKVWYEEESVLWPEPEAATGPTESPANSSDPADATAPGEKPAGK